MIKLNIDNAKTLEFTQDIIRVGRNKNISDKIEIVKSANSADIFLKDKKALSRKHCEIFQKDFQWYIKDLGSSNGTYLNNKKIEPHEEYPLRDEDKLQLSRDVCICVSLSEDSTVIDDDMFPIVGGGEEDVTTIDIVEHKEDDIESTKRSNRKVFYLESINNRYKAGAFKLDFSDRDLIDLVELLDLNIGGEITLKFNGGYVAIENGSRREVSVNNKPITQSKIVYDGNIIDIGDDRFIFVEYTSREIINENRTSRPRETYRPVRESRARETRGGGYSKTEVVNPQGFSSDEPTLELAPYTTLNGGQYIILERLGEVGGFGITYLAEDSKLNSKVAIKEYFPRVYATRDENNNISPINTAESRENFKWGYEAFKKEAQTIANIPRHNNIVDVKNLFEENGTVYYVMAYTQGEDLESYLKRHGQLNQKEIERILYPFLDGVKHIHKYNILHRDIKLSNILITKDGTPILIDFGTARNQMIQRSKKLTSVYTAGYASLEQHIGGEEGEYTDIYSIGMLIYAMMNGITKTEDLPSAVKRLDIEQSKKGSDLKFPKGFSKGFINAVKRSLEVKHVDRPQNIDELIALFKVKESNPKVKYIAIGVAVALVSAGLILAFLNK